MANLKQVRHKSGGKLSTYYWREHCKMLKLTKNIPQWVPLITATYYSDSDKFIMNDYYKMINNNNSQYVQRNTMHLNQPKIIKGIQRVKPPQGIPNNVTKWNVIFGDEEEIKASKMGLNIYDIKPRRFKIGIIECQASGHRPNQFHQYYAINESGHPTQRIANGTVYCFVNRGKNQKILNLDEISVEIIEYKQEHRRVLFYINGEFQFQSLINKTTSYKLFVEMRHSIHSVEISDFQRNIYK